MKLIDAEKGLTSCREYWIVYAIFDNSEYEPYFYLCFSEEDARKKFNSILPLDIEIQTIQNQIDKNNLVTVDNNIREKIIARGEWINPFGSVTSKFYNGYPSIYRMRKLADYEIVDYRRSDES